MAKEVVIIFVYDTQILQNEEDDPSSAILYFHPTWVSDQQRTALCGQIIGATRCIKSIFSPPKIVSLQSGKFYIIENGRYLLATGTDRNISDWLLEHRAKTLYSIINFFHNDFCYLSDLYKETNNLSAKLYHMFETYLKMLVFGGNIFSHIPTLALPKSASNVFTEAIHLLQCCQEMNNVLGGTMLYHNKVVATQFTPELTKRIVLTDPYRIKCPAEKVEVNFELPIGVQLLQVFISSSEYHSLMVKNSSIFQYLSNKKSIKKTHTKQSSVQDPIISQMKRDQSLIFTMVPEEDSDHSISNAESILPANKKTRPKFLNLKSNSIDLDPKPAPKSVTTPYCGQTSVCSTPLVELKKFVHQNALLICANPVEDSKEMNYSMVHKSPEKSVAMFDMNAKKITKSCSQTNLNSINDGEIECTVDIGKNRCKTINDPTFPVFNGNGKVISSSYYNQSIINDLETINQVVNPLSNNKSDPFKGFDMIENTPDIKKNDNKETDVVLRAKLGSNNKEQRKSLTLPLKSLSMDSNDQVVSPITVNRKYSSGVQLTPLMSRLSMLAFEERSSGFGSQSTTPGDFRGMTPTQNFNFSFNKQKINKEIKNNCIDDTRLHKCILFVCGQQDIVLTLLLKEDCCQTPEVINKLWEICTDHLGKLEKQLHLCMESQPSSNSHESDPYSYLLLDSNWDTVQRGGPWGTTEMGVLNCLHKDFSEVPNLTDILIRGNDSIIYGNLCGQTEVFYHETATPNGGLPPPADPMGQVQLKARRRLERDHTIILL